MRNRAPLTALRAFECAARHLSFSRAAEELHVTAAALSFQIRALEKELGMPVFERLPRRIELTRAGRELLPGIAEGFSRIDQAWQLAHRRRSAEVLTVTAGPAFTGLWLAPRIYAFAADHPDIEVRLHASLRLSDLSRDDVDVAIRFGQGVNEALYSITLFNDWLTPVVAPELVEQYSSIESLAEAPLLHDDSASFIKPQRDWSVWMSLFGCQRSDTRGTRFSHADHAVSAAIGGAGVLLGRASLIGNALREGRLVAPFHQAIDMQAGFRLLCLPGQEEREDIAAFMDWMKAQMRFLDELAEGFDIHAVAG
ncbi:MAG: transcriptional regulator [Gammaproteobacteria bacterium]|nr:MAG: transcriptional regulator [Gammaproteobacteria bacterium]